MESTKKKVRSLEERAVEAQRRVRVLSEKLAERELRKTSQYMRRLKAAKAALELLRGEEDWKSLENDATLEHPLTVIDLEIESLINDEAERQSDATEAPGA